MMNFWFRHFCAAFFAIGAAIGSLTGLLTASVTAASAQARFDPYTVTGVRITWKSADGNIPPPSSVSRGAARAGAVLLRRLTSENNHSKLPVLTPANARRLLDTHKIGDVASVKGRRNARVDYQFSPGKVKALLAQARIAVVDRVSPPIVILPVWKAVHGPVLWDDPNPLRRAWQGESIRPGLVRIVIPDGGLKDLQRIDGAAAARGDRAALARIATGYGAGAALLVLAEPSGGQLRLSVTSYPVDVALPPGAVWTIATQRTAAGYKSALDKIVSRLTQQWKASAGVPAGPVSRLAVTAPLNSFAHWVALRRSMNAVPRVKRIQVRQLSSREVQLTLHYVGSLEGLRRILRQKGLRLARLEDRDGAVIWQLSTPRSPADGSSESGASKPRPQKKQPAR